MTIIGRYTKWSKAAPVSDITVEVVAQALYDIWIMRFDCPLRIKFDQGRQFESTLFNAEEVWHHDATVPTSSFKVYKKRQLRIEFIP